VQLRDRGLDLPSGTPHSPIHDAPPALNADRVNDQIFATGIEVIDLLAPLAQGGKAAMFGGAGCCRWT